MVTLFELHDHMWRKEKSTEGQTPLQHSIDLGFMAILSSVKSKVNTLGIYKKTLRAWAWTQSNISGETWKCASAPIQQSRQSLRGEEVRRRRIADNWPNADEQSLSHQTKKAWGCKGASAKYLVKGMSTYAIYLFQFFLFVIHLQSCDNSVFALSIWCMECRLM